MQKSFDFVRSPVHFVDERPDRSVLDLHTLLAGLDERSDALDGVLDLPLDDVDDRAVPQPRVRTQDHEVVRLTRLQVIIKLSHKMLGN